MAMCLSHGASKSFWKRINCYWKTFYSIKYNLKKFQGTPLSQTHRASQDRVSAIKRKIIQKRVFSVVAKIRQKIKQKETEEVKK